MSTIFSVATAALVAVLKQSPPVAPVVDRVLLRAVGKNDRFAVVVRPFGGNRDSSVGAGVVGVWTTGYEIECSAWVMPDVAPDLAVDPLLEAVYARLMANPTLGGAVADLQPAPDNTLRYGFDQVGENTVTATLSFHVRHASGAHTLASP